MADEFVKRINPLEGSEPEIILPPDRKYAGQTVSVQPPFQQASRTAQSQVFSGSPSPPQTSQESSPQQISQTPRQQASIYEAPRPDNTNRNFKGQQKNEIVLCFTRKHWIVLLPHFIGFAIFVLAVAGFLILISEDAVSSVMEPFTYRALAFIALVGLTFYLHRFFTILFNYYLQVFIVTNFRIIQLDYTLYFTHNRDSIDIREIQDIVNNQKGIFQTLLNYGSVTITLSSAHATKVVSYLPNPEYFFRKINKTKREYITSRGFEKAAAGPEQAVGARG